MLNARGSTWFRCLIGLSTLLTLPRLTSTLSYDCSPVNYCWADFVIKGTVLERFVENGHAGYILRISDRYKIPKDSDIILSHVYTPEEDDTDADDDESSASDGISAVDYYAPVLSTADLHHHSSNIMDTGGTYILLGTVKNDSARVDHCGRVRATSDLMSLYKRLGEESDLLNAGRD